MKYSLKFILILSVGILCSACAQRMNDKPYDRSDTNFNSTLWMQSSSEFKASSLQVYNSATRNLGQAVKNITESAALEQTAPDASLPSAVILDIDETVLDNSMHDAMLILAAENYMSATWDQWIALAIVVIGLYIADVKHFATIKYNFFLLLLFGMITGLILYLKVRHKSNKQDE